MNKLAIYPGSFDPITLGHIDIIERSSKIFDIVHILIAENINKNSMFTAEERYEMVLNAVKHIQNIVVKKYDGIVVDYAKKVGAVALIRGIRAISEVDYEFQLDYFNRKLAPEISTIFMAPAIECAYISSTSVRDLIRLNLDIVDYVPDFAAKYIKEKNESND